MIICLSWIDSVAGFAFTILVEDNAQALPSYQFADHFLQFMVAPEQFSSDSGLQLNSMAFKEFFSRWGVKHHLSSVEYPRSNGRVELGV